MAKTLPTVAVIEQTHEWSDCIKVTAPDGFRHCHCALQVAAIRAGEPRTCSHCGIVEEAASYEQPATGTPDMLQGPAEQLGIAPSATSDSHRHQGTAAVLRNVQQQGRARMSAAVQALPPAGTPVR